jgi:CHAD domain-containing protein
MTLLEQQSKTLLDDFSRSIAKLTKDISRKGVHSLRTTARRIESVIVYCHPEPGKKEQKVLSELSALRKRAGKVRDFDVQIGLMGSIANGSTRSDCLALTVLLRTKRARQARRLRTAVNKEEESKILLRLDKILRKATGSPEIDSSADPLQQAKSELAKLASGYPVSRPLKAKRLHEVRIALKRIRYTAELAAAGDEQTRFVQELKQVQDAVGEWHDWEILTHTVEKQFEDRLNCPLRVEIRSLFSAKQSAAAAAVARLFSDGRISAKKPLSVTPSSRALRRSA